LIKRVRDKNSGIRETIFSKLMKDRALIFNLDIQDIYKLLYDGLGSREACVREIFLKYLA
jgi:hypothetical protein